MGSLQKIASKDLADMFTNNKPDGSRKWHDDEKVPTRYSDLDKTREISSRTCSSIKTADRLGAKIQSGPRASSMRVFRSNLSVSGCNSSELVAAAPMDSVCKEDDELTLKQPWMIKSVRHIQITPAPDVHHELMRARDSYHTGYANTPKKAMPEPLGSSQNGEVVISKTYVLSEKEVASFQCGRCGKQLGVMIRGILIGEGLSKFCQTCHPLPPPPSAWRCAETPTTPKKKRGLIHSWRKVFHLEKPTPSYLVK